jgi:energy-coupling factor transport system ATP-binding protein
VTAAASVELRGFGYRPPGRKAWALRDLNLTVCEGEHVLLLGASGAGKSTLLRAVAGLLDDGGDTLGEVRVGGRGASRGNPAVGLLLQDPEAHLVLSRVDDDVAFGLRMRGVAPDLAASRADEALRTVGLSPTTHGGARRVQTLSGGERQRVALAGVLAHQPAVMLLDEPTSMLDPDGAELVRSSVSRIARATSTTMIVVEHRVSDWLPLVDRVVVLGPHGLVADGPPQQVLTDRSLQAQGVWLPDVAAGAHRPRRAGAPLLHAERVSVRHAGSTVDAVKDVSLTLDAGRATALTGANGSGKSSLALVLGGLVRPGRGDVTAAQPLCQGVTETRPHRWSSTVLAARIGSVFQNPEHAFVGRTVVAELAAGPRALGLGDAEVSRLVDELIERTHLAAVSAANPFTLSGGQQRRLSVAAALAVRPRVLVLDEPTFGQDPRTWLELVDLLGSLCDEGHSLLVATHDEPFVAALADARLRLHDGRRAEALL